MKRAKSARLARNVPPRPEYGAMTQLTLDIRPETPSTFDTFVGGANAELVAQLHALATPQAYDAIYVWGPPGSGRSHLLLATAAQAQESGRPVSFIRGVEAGAELHLPSGGLVIVDDADHLSLEGQIGLFRAFNTARLVGLALLVSGEAPPARLALREDLRTRIGAALIYEVRPLTDEEKAQTLAGHALARGMRFEPEIIDYLLRHGRRDLPSLMAVLDALDRASLQQKRPITLPLLREILVSSFESRVSG